MIFNEDSTLLSFFEKYEEEDDIKEAVLKYCHGGNMNMSRSELKEIKIEEGNLDQVFLLNYLTRIVYKSRR